MKEQYCRFPTISFLFKVRLLICLVVLNYDGESYQNTYCWCVWNYISYFCGTARMPLLWFIKQTLPFPRRQIQTNLNAPQYWLQRFISYTMYFYSTKIIWNVLLKWFFFSLFVHNLLPLLSNCNTNDLHIELLPSLEHSELQISNVYLL